MVTPTPSGKINPLVLYAAKIVGINKIIKIGGAQAIAALTYGTESIEAVDKIVGPGNSFVAAAKRKLFGQVGIDSVAGPSPVITLESYFDANAHLGYRINDRWTVYAKGNNLANQDYQRFANFPVQNQWEQLTIGTRMQKLH